MIDLLVKLLKLHFALYFTVRDYLLDKLKPLGVVYKYIFGFVFIVHDWVTNWLLTLKFKEKPISPFALVTTRLKRYKKLPKTDPRKIWADDLGAFANKYDPGHY